MLLHNSSVVISVSSSHASAWIGVIPFATLGLAQSLTEMQFALKWLLGLSITTPGTIIIIL